MPLPRSGCSLNSPGWPRAWVMPGRCAQGSGGRGPSAEAREAVLSSGSSVCRVCISKSHIFFLSNKRKGNLFF